MIWQDGVIAVAQGTFALALVPTLIAPTKPPLATSVPMAIGLTAITIAVATLELWWAATTGAATAILWAVIALQRWREGN